MFLIEFAVKVDSKIGKLLILNPDTVDSNKNLSHFLILEEKKTSAII